ncbi:MAG: PRD domain-containing protein, partial [Bacteroidia bacterium]|nr:PRD domain-containing protein [Bacteroidia bacterium]
HFVNAQIDSVDSMQPKSEEDQIIEYIVEIISQYFSLDIKRNTYNYQRLILHLRSYLYRMETNDQFEEDNTDLINSLKDKYPEIYKCAKIISEYILKEKNVNSSNDEVLYLMLHIRRVTNT